MSKDKDIEQIKQIICKSIAEATGTPIDFQEGHCANIQCEACIYNNLPKTLVEAGYGNTNQAVKRFEKAVFDELTELLSKKHITSANEIRQVFKRVEEV